MSDEQDVQQARRTGELRPEQLARLREIAAARPPFPPDRLAVLVHALRSIPDVPPAADGLTE